MSPVIYLADWTAKTILSLFGITISRSCTEGEEGEGGEPLPSSRSELRRQTGEGLANVGLVTTTDAFEAIAGDLEDPTDERLEHGA